MHAAHNSSCDSKIIGTSNRSCGRCVSVDHIVQHRRSRSNLNPHMDKTTQQLCNFTRDLKYTDLPAVGVTAAKARVLSTLAVALAAYDMTPIRIVRKLAQPVAAGRAAAILGSLLETTPEMAAFVNSAMVRCLDMSDSYVMQAVSHPADAFPAILAVG